MALEWEGMAKPVETLAVYAIGILVYSLVMHGLYGFLSQRDMFGAKPGAARVAGRAFGYIALFPLVSFVFFMCLVISFLFLADNSADPMRPFIVSMGIVMAVRLCAYISEAAAHELAKLLPLGLLGYFLVTFQYQGLLDSFKQLKAIGQEVELVAVFFLLLVALEFVMRGVVAVARASRKGKGAKAPTNGRPHAHPRPTAQPTGQPAVAFQRK